MKAQRETGQFLQHTCYCSICIKLQPKPFSIHSGIGHKLKKKISVRRNEFRDVIQTTSLVQNRIICKWPYFKREVRSIEEQITVKKYCLDNELFSNYSLLVVFMLTQMWNCLYIAEILPIRHKTLSNQSINQSNVICILSACIDA